MISITLDIPVDFDGVIDDYVQEILSSAADLARAELVRLAQAGLNTTRRAYISGIQPVTISGDLATITLMGSLANKVEWGYAGGDMREDLIDRNPKARGNNTYAYIPFRHSSAGAAGHDTGAAMPGNIYEAAKALAPTISAPMQSVKWGEKLPSGLASISKPTHSTDIYSGMYRMSKDYEQSSGSHYMTFRTISKKKGVGWIHPGIESRGFFNKTVEYLEQILPAMVENSIVFK